MEQMSKKRKEKGGTNVKMENIRRGEEEKKGRKKVEEQACISAQLNS